MSVKQFVDTNILVYAYDISAGDKHILAKNCVRQLWDSGMGVVSAQVLQELFVTLTKKIPKPIDSAQAKLIIDDLSQWEVVVSDIGLITASIDLHERYKFSFWDDLVVQAALVSGAKVLLTEDLQGDQMVEGLAIKNPL